MRETNTFSSEEQESPWWIWYDLLKKANYRGGM